MTRMNAELSVRRESSEWDTRRFAAVLLNNNRWYSTHIGC